MPDIELSGLSVALVMVCRGPTDITVPTTNSLISTIMALNEHQIPVETNIHTGGSLLDARSYSVEKFLQGPRNRFFSLDSDVAWEPEAVLRILALSTRYPVIGAAYTAKRDKPFFLMHAEPGVVPDEFGCIPISGMGLGFTCIHRSVLAELSANAPLVKYTGRPSPIREVFRFDKLGDSFRGEDFAFGADVHALGHKVMCDPSITLRHLGTKEFSGRLADHLVPHLAVAE